MGKTDGEKKAKKDGKSKKNGKGKKGGKSKKNGKTAPPEMSRYERRALDELEDWLNPEPTFWSRTRASVSRPFVRAGDAVLSNKVGEVVGKAMHQVVDVLNDGASWTVRTGAIYEELAEVAGSEVASLEEVRRLDLAQVDQASRDLTGKYRGIAAVEGSAAGTLGGTVLWLDIPALIGLNLRAINEHATYYGFDPSDERERHYAIQMLMLTSSPTKEAKRETLIHMNKLALGVAQEKSWAELEKHLVVRGFQEVARALGIRLAKAKLGQVIPLVGGVVGGTYNAWYTSATCKTAYYMYRRRFLATKYGESVFDA